MPPFVGGELLHYLLSGVDFDLLPLCLALDDLFFSAEMAEFGIILRDMGTKHNPPATFTAKAVQVIREMRRPYRHTHKDTLVLRSRLGKGAVVICDINLSVLAAKFYLRGFHSLQLAPRLSVVKPPVKIIFGNFKMSVCKFWRIEMTEKDLLKSPLCEIWFLGPGPGA